METRNTICFGEKIFIESAQNNVNDQRFCLTEQGSSIRIVLLLPSVELFKMHGVGDHQARTMIIYSKKRANPALRKPL